MSDKVYLNAHQVAFMADISVRQVWYLNERNELPKPTHPPGKPGYTRWLESEIREWLE